MFGKNKLEKSDKGSGDTLEVNSIFYTLQGEGPYAGRPSVFVRLAGCNLRCYFCDTEFEKRTTMTVEEIMAEVESHAFRGNEENALVVLSGGEPLRQQIIPLLVELLRKDLDVQIETAGTVIPADVKHRSAVYPLTFSKLLEQPNLMLVCSPKTGQVHPVIAEHCGNWKYIIREGETCESDGLPLGSTQNDEADAKIYRPHKLGGNVIWVQPMMEYHDPDGPPNDSNVDIDATHDNAQAAAASAMAYGYRLSFQIHKALGLP